MTVEKFQAIAFAIATLVVAVAVAFFFILFTIVTFAGTPMQQCRTVGSDIPLLVDNKPVTVCDTVFRVQF